MEEQKISVVINTYNEETRLEACVKAVSGFDEVVVCDMESTDGTVELARRLGCKVVTFPKGNHKIAEPARQFAIDNALCPWVLVVDADEIVTPPLRAYLYNIIANPDGMAGLYIPRRGFFMGQEFGYPDYQLRFFRKEGTTWPPFVHSAPQITRRVDRIPRQRKELAFIHLANESIHSRLRKANEYTDQEVEKRKAKSYGFFHLSLVPAWWFFRSYILKGGILKGKAGLVNSTLDAIYKFATIAKMIESKLPKSQLIQSGQK